MKTADRINRSRLVILTCLTGMLSFSTACKKSDPVISEASPVDSDILEEQALDLQEKGDYLPAEALFRQCLSARTQALGPEDIDTLSAKIIWLICFIIAARMPRLCSATEPSRTPHKDDTK